MTDTYNGWANVDNEEGSYNYRRHLFPNGTPDMDGSQDLDNLDNVDWVEVAEGWSSEARVYALHRQTSNF
jgi:hypothetical protein